MINLSRTLDDFNYRFILAVTGAALAVLLSARPAFPDDLKINSPAAQAEAKRLDAEPAVKPKSNRIAIDQSGRKEEGKASVYSRSFDGKKVADGEHLNPHANVAASKTLPLGTVAKVTNQETGKSTEVKVVDRGPFVGGRVLDLTPQAAKEIGLTKKQGVVPVVVAPIAVPQRDGTVKAGAGAAELGPGKPARPSPETLVSDTDRSK